MQYLGDFSPGDTIYLKFTTGAAGGAPTALTSGTVSVYKDDSTTESTSGVTLTAGFDSRAGFNHVTITSSSDGSFYSASSSFFVVLTAGTVDGVSMVGYVIGYFTMRRAATYAAVTGLNNLSEAQVNAQVDAALADYDPPTKAEMDARTLASADYATASALGTVDSVVDGIASGLVTVDSNVDAIKAKTDSLNFGVTGKVDANITHVNEVEVVGDGDGTKWGPA